MPSSTDVDAMAALAWEGVLPVHCTLADGLVDTNTADNHCYFMVPRQGYLGFSLKVVLRTFSHLPVLLDPTRCFIWFSYSPGVGQEPVVLPWHYPMGVVCDRIASKLGYAGVSKLFNRALELTVTFSEAPPVGEEVVPMTVAGLERGTELRIKQAQKQYLMTRYTSIKPWVNFDSNAYANFLLAPRTNDAGAFFVGRNLLEQQVRRDLPAEYEAGSDTAFVVLHVDQNNVIPYRCDVRRLPTLGAILREALPFCARLDDAAIQAIDPLPLDIGCVSILGTEPPLCVPTAFLRDHLCCPDLAVHVVVCTKISSVPVSTGLSTKLRTASAASSVPKRPPVKAVEPDGFEPMSTSQFIAAPPPPRTVPSSTPSADTVAATSSEPQAVAPPVTTATAAEAEDDDKDIETLVRAMSNSPVFNAPSGDGPERNGSATPADAATS